MIGERLEAAIARAIDTNILRDLWDELGRGSKLPSPTPNLELARAVGARLARERGKAEGVLATLFNSTDEFGRIVAAMTFSARALSGFDRRGSLAGLEGLAEDGRKHVRTGLVAALRDIIAAEGEKGIEALAVLADGYLHAHLLLEALADRHVLDGLPRHEPVLQALESAYRLADQSPRAAERSQGVRLLRSAMPAQIAMFAARFPEILTWLTEHATRTERPESREILEATIVTLRKRSLPRAAADRLAEVLKTSAKPDRNAARIVQGTRKRARR
jgi:hypothetical protein